MWYWAAIVSLALVGCRGGTSAPRHRPARHPLPASSPPSPSLPASTPLDAGEVVFRGNLRYVSVCLGECERMYVLCSGNTPECEDLERLFGTLRDATSHDAGPNDAMASTVLSVLVSERTGVCMTRCGEPRRVCMRQCFDAADDAGRPLR